MLVVSARGRLGRGAEDLTWWAPRPKTKGGGVVPCAGGGSEGPGVEGMTCFPLRDLGAMMELIKFSLFLAK